MNKIISYVQTRIYYIISPKFSADYREEIHCIEKINLRYKDKFSSDEYCNCFWRSIAQYDAHAYFRSTFSLYLANFLSVVGLFLAPLYLSRNRFKAKERIVCKYLKVDFNASFLVPNELKDCVTEVSSKARYLTFYDFLFVVGIFVKYRVFYPELLLRFLLWISFIRPIIDKYSPEFLIQYCEYSPHSSLRKVFLNHNGILLANVTHGEEFISTRSAFSTFDKYYCWFITEEAIHLAMRIQYSVRVTFDPTENCLPAPIVEHPVIGILWPTTTGVDLELFVRKINEISISWRVVVRPHPNPLSRNDFEHYVNQLNAEVSDSLVEGVHSFIDRTSIIIGFTSATLLQASLRSRKVIYIFDGYLDSLLDYHPYYQTVKYAKLDCLETAFIDLH